MMIQIAANQGTIPSQVHTPRRMLTRLLALLASLGLMMLGLAFTSPAASADDIGMDAAASENASPGAVPVEDPVGLGAGTDAQGHGPGNEGGGTPPGGGDVSSPLADTPLTDTLPTDTPLTETPLTDTLPSGEKGGHGEEGTEEEGGHGEGSAVLVCLATGSRLAPYTAALFMPTAIIKGNGVPKENGPAVNPVEGVFPAEVWGNIIPVFTHPNGKGTYPGLNLTGDGQANLREGCGGDPPAPPIDSGHETVVVCIATQDSITPYEMEKWMVQKIINGKGMPHKNGPAVNPVEGVYPVDAVWGNIIPVFTHTNGKATYPGLNLEDGGQAILDAGCVYVVPAEPAPAPAPAPAAMDFCPDLDGVQWENYDCNTPQAVAAEVTVPAEPVVAVVAPSPATTAESVQPAAVTAPTAGTAPQVAAVPETATVPAAVPAGGGSSDPADGLTWVACLFILSCLSAAGSAARLVSSGASLR
jgi:hypothetical protein